MRLLLCALLLIATPAAAADNLYALYASGRYDDAIRAGTQAGSAEGFAIAARAALAVAAMRPEPCLPCLRQAEDFARKAVAADIRQSDGHVWLAAALGLEGRIVGMVRARLANSPAEAKSQLDDALKDDPANPYALAALGGWHIEIVRAGGAFLARRLYDAREEDGLLLFDRAVKAAPDNVAVHYQIALSLAGYQPDRMRGRIAQELDAAIKATPQTEYEKFIQTRAAELQAAQAHGDANAFAAKVHQFQGYPS
jgi:hypothetical protein